MELDKGGVTLVFFVFDEDDMTGTNQRQDILSNAINLNMVVLS